jgi:16S rRNA (adenine1518-N6/adenine1519-N6)-dimethyltransferase
MEAKQSLGQHWLKDKAALNAICGAANLGAGDTVLEIGPGLGDLTQQLVKRAGEVIAVELDSDLAVSVNEQVNAKNLKVINQDIRKFDLNALPLDYKVVANIPYYLTSYLIRLLSETVNRPRTAVLLVQREVADRLAAQPGEMSMLSITAQFYYEAKLGPVMPSALFDPPPKVDSQVIILSRRPKPLFGDVDTKLYFRLVKAGFAGRRKKLRSSLAAGLRLTKPEAEKLLKTAGVNSDRRAQELSLEDWHKLYTACKKVNIELL